jgi:hypothetical protein
MPDLTPVIETMEHRWMRAWVNGDIKAFKSITAKNFILLTGSKPPAILDRTSWLEGAANRYLCSSYRFGDIYVRGFGSIAVFAAPLELKATMDGRDWSGPLAKASPQRLETRPAHRLQDRRQCGAAEGDQVASAVEGLAPQA